MKKISKAALFAALFASSTVLARADVNVVTSIKPVHSLVASVMKGVGEPSLIVDGAASPHAYALKPSQAAALESADLVFWVGHSLETFLEKPLETIAAKAKKIELLDSHDLVKLSFREGEDFEGHDHGDHEGHDDHAGHDHDKHEEHAEHDHDKHEEHAEHDHDKHEDHAEHDHDKHEEHAGHDHDKHEDHAEHDHDKHEEHAGHDHDKHEEHAEHDHDKHEDHAGHDHADGETDPHIWLDPQNAKAMVHEIEEALVAADPGHADAYKANAAALEKKLDALIADTTSLIEPVKGNNFIVFHDAYHYFEDRFGLEASGSITISPESAPGAERVQAMRSKVKDLNAVCIFSEPQFEPKLVATVAEGTNAKTGTLDPLGAEIENGPDLYFDLITNMAASFKSCLSEPS